MAKSVTATPEPDEPAGEQTPAVELDLAQASSRAFFDAIDKFYEWSDSQPELGPLEIESGWHVVTWPMAEEFLRRNVCNREPGLAHVKKLLYDMQNKDWRRTGQGLVFNESGKLNEGQQRCWASYFGKVSFPTYIVTDAPDEADLFAYYDDVKPRSAADALQTSGVNGISRDLANACYLHDRYERDVLGVIKQPKVHKLTHREILAYSRANASLNDNGHIVLGNYGKAVSVISHKGVAICFGDLVINEFGLAKLDGFLVPLGSGANLDEDDPVLGLRNRLFQDDKINKERILALLIKAFNYHLLGKKISIKQGLYVRDNEKFPRLLSAAAVTAEPTMAD